MKRLTQFALLAALCLAGCALFREAVPTAPKTVRQAVLLATYETAAVMNAASDSYRQGLIPKEALEAVTDQSEKAKASLKVAQQALAAGDISTAQGQLAVTQALLAGMRAALGATQ